jgi:hypothetical protein
MLCCSDRESIGYQNSPSWAEWDPKCLKDVVVGHDVMAAEPMNANSALEYERSTCLPELVPGVSTWGASANVAIGTLFNHGSGGQELPKRLDVVSMRCMAAHLFYVSYAVTNYCADPSVGRTKPLNIIGYQYDQVAKDCPAAFNAPFQDCDLPDGVDTGMSTAFHVFEQSGAEGGWPDYAISFALVGWGAVNFCASAPQDAAIRAGTIAMEIMLGVDTSAFRAAATFPEPDRNGKKTAEYEETCALIGEVIGLVISALQVQGEDVIPEDKQSGEPEQHHVWHHETSLAMYKGFTAMGLILNPPGDVECAMYNQ